jgi:hypothetical protein
MTVEFLVLYTQPDDPAATSIYFDTHMPLVCSIPGCSFFGPREGAWRPRPNPGSRCTTGRRALLRQPGGLEASLGSAEGKATAADYQQIAPPGSKLFIEAIDD